MDNLITMLMVSDMERSVKFYRDALGLTLRMESPEWSEFDFGKVTLALHGGAPPSPSPRGAEQYAGMAGIGFTVPDLERACEDLKAKGVRFVMEPIDRPEEGIRLAVALDPDGLAVSFAQVLQKP